MNHNETASPPLYPPARAARRLRGRPSGLKGRYRARCATGLRPALDPGASAAPDAQTVRAGGALPATPRGAHAPTIKIKSLQIKSLRFQGIASWAIIRGLGASLCQEGVPLGCRVAGGGPGK